MPAPKAWTEAEHVDEDGRPVGLAPELRADPLAGVEAEPEQGRQVAADHAEAGQGGLEAHREGHRDAGDAGIQPGVAEQGDAVDGDRDDPGQRRLLVDRRAACARGRGGASPCRPSPGRGRPRSSPGPGRPARRRGSPATSRGSAEWSRRPRSSHRPLEPEVGDAGSAARRPAGRPARPAAVVDDQPAALGEQLARARRARRAAPPWRGSRPRPRCRPARWRRPGRSRPARRVAGSSR